MQERYRSLADFEQELITPSPPGQPQSDESIERERKFAAHAAVIEELRQARLNNAVQPTKRRAGKPPRVRAKA